MLLFVIRHSAVRLGDFFHLKLNLSALKPAVFVQLRSGPGSKAADGRLKNPVQQVTSLTVFDGSSTLVLAHLVPRESYVSARFRKNFCRSAIPLGRQSSAHCRSLLTTGYAPDGECRPPHQGREAETPTEPEGNPACTGSYPKVSTCFNRIGIGPCV